MRAKKSREVNIFSASVVDLFASGLGVFIIVSIIALINQKKEIAKALEGDQANKQASEVQEELAELTAKVEQLSQENFKLKAQRVALKDQSKKDKQQDVFEMKVELEMLKSELVRKEEASQVKMKELKDQLSEKDKLIADLENKVKVLKSTAYEGKEGVAFNFSNFEIGSKIQLENVHFYPGTDRAIEPYSSREIGAFAKFMKQNPQVTVEVSGHIFETKKAIESGKADDIYNLSGRRARHVCMILESFGINPKRLSCVGYGASRPIIMTNDQYSEEAQRNRRVEIEILSK